MNPKNKYQPTSPSVSSQGIIWNGPKIPCLEICDGDSLNDVVYAIAIKLCQAVADIGDVSTMDLKCLAESVPSDEKNLAKIVEVLIDSHCTLKDLVDSLEPSSTNVTLSLNLKCLKKFDEFGNEIPQDLNQTLQSIVNQVCTNKDDIAILKGKVDDLQDQIDNLPEPVTYTEPNLELCTTGTTEKLSDAVAALDESACDYKTVVGTTDEISSALARQCANLSALLGSTDGWISSPNSLADTVNNLWLLACNLMGRVTAMENTCCAPACDKIKLGFIVTFNDDNTVDLDFTMGAGTFIPNGFVDCGTTITFTDKDGVELSVVNPGIEQDGSIDGINISTLSQGPITVKFKTSFCLLDANDAVILTCKDCITTEFMNTSGCCVITNGDTAQTIVYKQTVTS